MSRKEIQQQLRNTGMPDGVASVIMKHPQLLKRFAFISAINQTKTTMQDELTEVEKRMIGKLSEELLLNFNSMYDMQIEIDKRQTLN